VKWLYQLAIKITLNSLSFCRNASVKKSYVPLGTQRFFAHRFAAKILRYLA